MKLFALVAAGLLGASCASSPLRLDRAESSTGEAPVYAVASQINHLPMVPSLSLGLDVGVSVDEIGTYAARDPRPYLLHLTSDPRPLPATIPVFAGIERRAAFVPAVEAKVQAALDK